MCVENLEKIVKYRWKFIIIMLERSMLRGRVSNKSLFSLFFLLLFLSINIHRFKIIQLCVIHLFESAEFKDKGVRSAV